MSDFLFKNHGSICLLFPQTSEAVNWVDENVGDDRTNYCSGFVVEPRYVDDLIAGITGDGLTVE